MADAIVQNEAINEKVYLASKLLNEGKDKYSVARVVGYKDVSGLDKYAKRVGYSWNKNTKNYELVDSTELTESSNRKAQKIIALIRDGMSIDDIAKYFRMKNSQELADYMNSKGYEWNMEAANYKRRNVIKLDEGDENEQEDEQQTTVLDENLDIMELLQSNKGKLIELLSFKPKSTIPRYLLKGMPVTKGFFISVEVDRLIKNFSREKNISQKDIIQTALIEFFNKYGFKDEVDILLKS
jgi:DNA-binding transcriptional MerR regulator